MEERARAFIKQHNIKDELTWIQAKTIAKGKGFAVLKYNKSFDKNTQYIQVLLLEFDAVEYSQGKDAFIINLDEKKYIFINEELETSTAIILLLHETAHIILNHLSNEGLFKSTPNQEIEATSFAIFVKKELDLSKQKNIKHTKMKQKATKAFVIVVTALLIAALIQVQIIDKRTKEDAATSNLPVSDDYTPPSPDIQQAGKYTGTVFKLHTRNVFHKPSCYIVNKRSPDDYATMPIETALAAGLEPCGHCLSEYKEEGD